MKGLLRQSVIENINVKGDSNLSSVCHLTEIEWNVKELFHECTHNYKYWYWANHPSVTRIEWTSKSTQKESSIRFPTHYNGVMPVGLKISPTTLEAKWKIMPSILGKHDVIFRECIFDKNKDILNFCCPRKHGRLILFI